MVATTEYTYIGNYYVQVHVYVWLRGVSSHPWGVKHSSVKTINYYLGCYYETQVDAYEKAIKLQDYFLSLTRTSPVRQVLRLIGPRSRGGGWVMIDFNLYDIIDLKTNTTNCGPYIINQWGDNAHTNRNRPYTYMKFGGSSNVETFTENMGHPVQR